MFSIFKPDHYIEIRNFGLNVGTFIFAATLFFGAYGARGLLRQIAKVRNEGARSVSVLWTLTFCAMFATYLPYGVIEGKLALAAQALMRIPFYMALVPLIYKKRNGFTNKEWAFARALLAFALVVAPFHMDATFLGASVFGALIAADQPLRIVKTRKVEGVAPELLRAYLASSVFWFIYGWTLPKPDTVILTWSALYCVVYSTTLIAYRVYQPRP